MPDDASDIDIIDYTLRVCAGIDNPEQLEDKEWAEAYHQFEYKRKLHREDLEYAFEKSLRIVLSEAFNEDNG